MEDEHWKNISALFNHQKAFVRVYLGSSELNKELVINYGEGGLQIGKSRAWNILRPPPPQDGVKLFAPPIFKSGNFLRPSIWLQLQGKA